MLQTTPMKAAKEATVNVSSSLALSEFKRRVIAASGVAAVPSQLKLVMNAKILKGDSSSLTQLRVSDGATVSVLQTCCCRCVRAAAAAVRCA